MLFLAFFFALHFHNVAYFKNKSRQRTIQGGGSGGGSAGARQVGVAGLLANGDGNAWRLASKTLKENSKKIAINLPAASAI